MMYHSRMAIYTFIDLRVSTTGTYVLWCLHGLRHLSVHSSGRVVYITILEMVQHCCTRWRHQMEIFSASLALCEGFSPVIGEFPSQRPVARSFDVFCDLRLNKRLSKQSGGRWYETPLGSLWRHCNAPWNDSSLLHLMVCWIFNSSCFLCQMIIVIRSA